MKRALVLFFVMMTLGQGADETIREHIEKSYNTINYDYSKIAQKGTGVAIGFIDSAFILTHPSFLGKVGDTRGPNYISEVPSKSLAAMHGTHVAGIALGNFIHLSSSNADIYGIASKAALFGISNLNPDSPNQVDYDEVIFFFKSNNVRIVNNSWGLTYYPNAGKKIDNQISFAYSYVDFPSNTNEVFKVANGEIDLKATMELAKSGILQIHSSGNEGQRAPTINASIRSYDESLQAWINVGAIDQGYFTKTNDYFTIDKSVKKSKYGNNDVYIRSAFTDFSNSFKGAQAYSILAPGYEILSANAYFEKGVSPYSQYSVKCIENDEFCAFSGTSQAAPFVSGVAALVAEKYPFADGRLLADIILSTANSNIADDQLPKIIVKQSDQQWTAEQDNWQKHYYYDIIYTQDIKANEKNNNDLIQDLKTELQLTEEEAKVVVSHLMNGTATYMTKDELIGQGILDAEKALKGLAKLDANRLLDSDIKTAPSGDKQAFYTINTKGQNGEFSNDVSQVEWKPEWHNENAYNAPKELKNIAKIGLEKTGAGTLTLSGTNSYLGDTIASGGILKLTGSLTNSSVFAQNGGTFNLDGSGNVANDVTATNNGIVLLSGGTIEQKLYSKNNGIIQLAQGGSATIKGGVENAGMLQGQGTVNTDVENKGIIMSGFYAISDDINGGETLNIGGTFTQKDPNARLQIAFLKNGTNTDFSATNYAISGGILEYIPLQKANELIKAGETITINLEKGLQDKLDDFKEVRAGSTNILNFKVDEQNKNILNASMKQTAFYGGNSDLANALKQIFMNDHSPEYDAAFAAIEQLSPAMYRESMESIAASPKKQNLNSIDGIQKTLSVKNVVFIIDPSDNIGDLNPSSAVFKPTAALGDAHLQNIDDAFIKTKLNSGFTYQKTEHDEYNQVLQLFDIQAKKEIDKNSKFGAFVGLGHSNTANDILETKSNILSVGFSYVRDFDIVSMLWVISGGVSFNDLKQSVRYLPNSTTNARYDNYFLTAQTGIYKNFGITQNIIMTPIMMFEYNFIHQNGFSQSGGVFSRDFKATNNNFARIWVGVETSQKWVLNEYELTGSLYAFYWHRFNRKQSEELSFSVAPDLRFSNHFNAEKDGFYGGVSLQANRKNFFFKLSLSDEKASAYNQYAIMFRAGIYF